MTPVPSRIHVTTTTTAPPLSQACPRRRIDIEMQLLISGVESNPGPQRSHSTQPTSWKVAAMLLDVDEYEGESRKARHRVTYTDTDSPFLEERKPAQWTYAVKTQPKLKSPMAKMQTLLDQYEDAVYDQDFKTAKELAIKGQNWAQSYPGSIFAEIAPASSWQTMSRTKSQDLALDWCASLREQYESTRDRLGLPAITRPPTLEEYNELLTTNDSLSDELEKNKTECEKVKRWFSEERGNTRALQAQLAATQQALSEATAKVNRAAYEAACAAVATSTPPASIQTAAAPAADASLADKPVQTLRERLSEAHDTIFTQEAQLISMKAELDHVREQLHAARTVIHKMRLEKKTHPFADAPRAPSPVPATPAASSSPVRPLHPPPSPSQVEVAKTTNTNPDTSTASQPAATPVSLFGRTTWSSVTAPTLQSPLNAATATTTTTTTTQASGPAPSLFNNISWSAASLATLQPQPLSSADAPRTPVKRIPRWY